MVDDFMFVDDPEGLYRSEVSKVPPLSRAEEISCFEHLRAGGPQAKSAEKRLLEANLHLVISIAERYQSGRVHILDLIVKGNHGLLGALYTFADSGEDSFSDWAAVHIEHAIAAAAAFPEDCIGSGFD
ncbi:MAG: hypothetical protein ABI833_01465 [Acidobacteriota bacterium]